MGDARARRQLLAPERPGVGHGAGRCARAIGDVAQFLRFGVGLGLICVRAPGVRAPGAQAPSGVRTRWASPFSLEST